MSFNMALQHGVVISSTKGDCKRPNELNSIELQSENLHVSQTESPIRRCR